MVFLEKLLKEHARVNRLNYRNKHKTMSHYYKRFYPVVARHLKNLADTLVFSIIQQHTKCFPYVIVY